MSTATTVDLRTSFCLAARDRELLGERYQEIALHPQTSIFNKTEEQRCRCRVVSRRKERGNLVVRFVVNFEINLKVNLKISFEASFEASFEVSSNVKLRGQLRSHIRIYHGFIGGWKNEN